MALDSSDFPCPATVVQHPLSIIRHPRLGRVLPSDADRDGQQMAERILLQQRGRCHPGKSFGFVFYFFELCAYLAEPSSQKVLYQRQQQLLFGFEIQIERPFGQADFPANLAIVNSENDEAVNSSCATSRIACRRSSFCSGRRARRNAGDSGRLRPSLFVTLAIP